MLTSLIPSSMFFISSHSNDVSGCDLPDLSNNKRKYNTIQSASCRYVCVLHVYQSFKKKLTILFVYHPPRYGHDILQYCQRRSPVTQATLLGFETPKRPTIRCSLHTIFNPLRPKLYSAFCNRFSSTDIIINLHLLIQLPSKPVLFFSCRPIIIFSIVIH